MDSSKSIGKYYLISHLPIFHKLTEKQKSNIANRTQLIEYNKNEIIYHRGEKRSFFYIIISGMVQTYLESEHESVGILRKGSYFGLVSVLSHKPHSVTAKAITDLRLLRIPGNVFLTILQEIPALGIEFSRILSKRLRGERAGKKILFESNVISILSTLNYDKSCLYATYLSEEVQKEAGKKSIVISFHSDIDRTKYTNIKLFTVDSIGQVAEILSPLVCEFQYILILLPREYTIITDMAIEQSDFIHTLYDSEPSLLEIEKLTNELKMKNSKISDSSIVNPGSFPFENQAEFCKKINQLARTITGIRLGLALGGGAALGLAQIGIMKVLERENIKIDMVSGTSIGALLGGLWCSGIRGELIEEATQNFDSVYKMIRFLDISIPPRGMIAGNRLKGFLQQLILDKSFSDLEIPFRAVACDISKRKEMVLDSGKVVDAIMASIAIPGVFNPVHKEDGSILVDGGVVNPLPVSVLNAEGINRVIAVNSMPSSDIVMRSNQSSQGLVDIMINSLYSLQYRIAKNAAQTSDVYLNPILKKSSWYQFYRAKDFIALGEQTAESKLDEIKKLV